MLSNTTVDFLAHNTIAMKTTGQEMKEVSVCLTAKADGTKLKPFINFPGAKRETKLLNWEFKINLNFTRPHAITYTNYN